MIKLFSTIKNECPSSLCRKLMDILKDTKFINDPASYKYHHCYPHGLIVHCYEVYYELKKLVLENKLPYSDETLFLIAFGHDLDKIDSYLYNDDGTYGFKNTFKGKRYHGENSFHRLMKYLGEDELNKLQDIDIIKICILGHMGEFDRINKAKQFYRDHVDNCPLLWLTHLADMKSCELNGGDYFDLLDEELNNG